MSEKDILKGVPRTREALLKQRVYDLRPLARAITGPGTWISHALKEELVEAIVKGEPPLSTHTTSSDIPAYFNREPIVREPDLRGLDKSVSGIETLLAQTMQMVIRRELEPIIVRIERLERKYGVEEEGEKLTGFLEQAIKNLKDREEARKEKA